MEHKLVEQGEPLEPDRIYTSAEWDTKREREKLAAMFSRDWPSELPGTPV